MPRKKQFVYLKEIGCEEVYCSKCSRKMPKLGCGYWCADKGEYACGKVCMRDLNGVSAKGE
jgi:hypothetical protein